MLAAVIGGLLIFAFLFVTYELETQFIVTESYRVLDDLCGGIIAALIVYRYERRRSKYLNEGLKTIELMNHHVRNALNIIVLSSNTHSQGKLLEGIQTAVSRIDWALREILPGRVLDDYDENAAEKKQSHSAACLD
jgi:hypothetical protein